jgi:RND family efflux transporter MFP subunit
MTRFLYPALGIILIVATIVQVSATRASANTPAVRPAGEAAARVVAEGRVAAYPGAEVTVSAEAPGMIDVLRVAEKQRVVRGEVLATIASDDIRAALAVARARVTEADADIRLYQSEVSRAADLWKEDVGSRQAWEKAERDLDSARARRQSAIAEAARLEALVRKTTVTSPIDGVVIARHVDAGESVDIGEPVVTVADLERTRVEAEVDEFDAARVALGGNVVITAEGFEKSWSGVIEEVPDAVVNRRLKPQDPGKPIDTRVLLVKVRLDERTPLRLGQRVEVKIE